MSFFSRVTGTGIYDCRLPIADCRITHHASRITLHDWQLANDEFMISSG
jgi:hypothetical protein